MISIWFYCTDVHFNDWLLWGWWAGPDLNQLGFRSFLIANWEVST